MRNRTVPSELYVFLAGFIALAALGELALVTGRPWLFPSLGPTALMLFFTPMAEAARPRTAIGGHALGLLCGWLALCVTGLLEAGPANLSLLGHDRVIAAALALAATGGVMAVARVFHPPAGATTLIVALGLITRVVDLLIVELAIVVLVVMTLVLNRLTIGLRGGQEPDSERHGT